MQQVIKIFSDIMATSSKNEKQAIISANSENELFKTNLKFLLDSQIITGISKKKLNKRLTFRIPTEAPFSDWCGCMEYLKSHNTGSDHDIYWIQQFLKSIDKDDEWFYTSMITKSLKIGCDSKTANKAIPGLIDTWEVQLGSGYEKLKLNPGEKFYLSQKLNGNRASFYQGKLISRQGKGFKGFDHIIDNIKASGYQNYFIDGELIRKNTDNLSDNENFRVGSGIINSDAPTKEEIKFVIFDMFPAEEFMHKQSKKKYGERKQELLALGEIIKKYNMPNIEIINMVYEGNDKSKIDEWLQYAVDNDWEGLMINFEWPYECKRTTKLIKVKRFYTMDLRVIDILEGDGRLKGTFGSFVVEYKNNTVNVGSGFTDEQRDYIWKNRENLIGKIVEIKYKETSIDKSTGLESLQFPIFQRFRPEKTEPSYD